jgi:hypothetical protein
MADIRAVVAREIKEATPPFIFFLLLFHMIALTKAVTLEDYSFTALRAVGATVGALVVAKAILVVEMLSIAKIFVDKPAVQVLWKAFLYSVVVFVFRLIEEAIPLLLKQQGIVSVVETMLSEISWPLFGVLTLWVFLGLLLYCLAVELMNIAGPGKIRQSFFAGSR